MVRARETREQLEKLRDRLARPVIDADQAIGVLEQLIGQLREIEEEEEQLLR